MENSLTMEYRQQGFISKKTGIRFKISINPDSGYAVKEVFYICK